MTKAFSESRARNPDSMGEVRDRPGVRRVLMQQLREISQFQQLCGADDNSRGRSNTDDLRLCDPYLTRDFCLLELTPRSMAFALWPRGSSANEDGLTPAKYV